MEVCDLHAVFVCGFVDEEFAGLRGYVRDLLSGLIPEACRRKYLGVVLTDSPIFVPRNYVSAQITPSSHGSLAFIARNDQTPLIALFCLHIHFDIKHDNRPQIPHSLLRHSEQFRPIVIKFHPLDRRIEVPYFYAFARADVPEADGIIGGAGGEKGGAGVDVNGPEGALVAVVCAEAFTVGGEPGADDLVFGAGEEDIAVFGVSVCKCQRGIQ